MPYVTDDDSKAVKRIAEMEGELQEAKAEFERWLAAGTTPTSPAELIEQERGAKARTDRIQALTAALELQRALAGAALHAEERELASAGAQLAAAMSSFEDAQARLRQMGVEMSIQRIARVAYHFAERARSRQLVEGMGIEGSLSGKGVGISGGGGTVSLRKN